MIKLIIQKYAKKLSKKYWFQVVLKELFETMDLTEVISSQGKIKTDFEGETFQYRYVIQALDKKKGVIKVYCIKLLFNVYEQP